MKKYIIILIAGLLIAGSVQAGWWSDFLDRFSVEKPQNLAGTVCYPYQGCTGTSTIPTDGQLLIGQTNGAYNISTLTEGSNVTITNADGSITIASAGTDGAAWEYDSTNNALAPTSTPIDIYISGSATTTGSFTVGSNYLFVDKDSGFVGIGIAEPDVQLHIYAASAGAVRIEGTGDTNAALQFKSDNMQKSIIGYYKTDDGLKLSHLESGVTLATNQFIIQEGNVGIGTVTPDNLLVVDDSGSFQVEELANCDTIDTDAIGVFSCGADATGASVGAAWEYNSTNDAITPTTTNSNIYVAGRTTTTDTIFIDGSRNATQLTIQESGSQTEDVFVVEKSDGTDLFDIKANGEVDIRHTSTEDNELALDIEVDAAGFGDVNGIFIDYITGAIGAGIDEAAILINLNRFDSTDGDVMGIEVLSTTGSAEAEALHVGAGVSVFHQFSGIFEDMDEATVNNIDYLSSFITVASDTPMFAADNNAVVIGDAAQFSEIEFILDTVASGAGIKPTFEFSTGAGAWTTFSPTDGTNGMRNSGEIAWEPDEIPTWATGTSTRYFIRITRTQNSITTVPIEDIVQISATTEYGWDENADFKSRNATTTGWLNIGTTVPTNPQVAGDLFIGNNATTTNTLEIGADGELVIDGERFINLVAATTTLDYWFTNTAGIDTDGLTEGGSNLYYTQARVWTDITASTTMAYQQDYVWDISDNTNLTAGDSITLTDDDLDIDDVFLFNNADDTTSYGITMGSASTSDSMYIGGLLDVTGNTTMAAATTTHLGITGLDCSGYDNGGLLTIDGDGDVYCDDDDAGTGIGPAWEWDAINLGMTTTNTPSGIYLTGSATTTANFYATGYATTTGGLYTQGSAHIGGTLTIDEALTVVGSATTTGHLAALGGNSDQWNAAFTGIHDSASLAGQDYLTISGQVITAGEIEPDDLGASDFGGFDCDGTNCTIDDLFLKNTAADTTAFGITMGSATTTDSLDVGGYLKMTTAGDNFIYFDNAATNYCQWDDSADMWNWSNDLQITGIASSTAGFRVNDDFIVGSDGRATTTNAFDITDGTNGVRILPGATTTFQGY